MKVVFLDIDGVLNFNGFGINDMERYGFASELVDNLRTLLTNTTAKVVISSSWRMSDDLNSEIIGGSPWTKVLEDKLNLGSVIIGKIGYKNEYYRYWLKQNNFSEPLVYRGKYRGYDIKDWLDDHKEVKNFVILDDYVSESDIPKVYPDNYVRCNHGFLANELIAAIRILNS